MVVASDKFKGTLTSTEVAAAVGAGVRRVHPGATVVPIPVADGGDGTLAAVVAAGFELIPITATGPTGTPLHTAYARHRTPTNHGCTDRGATDGSSTDRETADCGSPQPFEGISPPVGGSPLVYEGRTPGSRGYPLERGPGGSGARGESGVRGSALRGESGVRESGGRGGSRSRGDVAVVELADVSGLVRLPGGRPAPVTATSYGTGEVIAAAIDSGCTRVILGIGGSASTDGGAGLVRALGARLLGEGGRAVASGRAATSLDLTALRRRLNGVEIVVACDVDNPLTGPNGAAAIYGPQKGANPQEVKELDAVLTRWADLVARETGRDLRDAPGAGAAGGVGFAALALLGAELRPGIDLVLELVGFHEKVAGADLVITGEGALDEQTLHGKAVAGIAAAAASASGPGVAGAVAPAGVPRSAAALGIPVVAVCGVNRLESDQLREAGMRAAYALTEVEPDVRRCLAEPVPLLERLGERIAVDHLTMTGTERGIA